MCNKEDVTTDHLQPGDSQSPGSLPKSGYQDCVGYFYSHARARLLFFVFRRPSHGDIDGHFRVIAVPGVGTTAPQDWLDNTGRPWLRDFPLSTAAGLVVCSFNHGLRPSDEFSWEVLLDHGGRLLTAITRFLEGDGVFTPESHPLNRGLTY